MATGADKTIVMAMLISWQALNKATYPQDARFSKYIFVIAPGLTVKNRLQVLIPSAIDNYYNEFNIVPPSLFEKLRQGKILIRNWHALQWETAEKLAKKKTVDKRGEKSNEAYVREVLGEMAYSNNFIVINDEAHHAWRIPAESKVKRVKKAELLRQMVDTVGQAGKPGADIQKVISVGMLSEGWDAKTVTHIMGLRAFSSQLLCEQVVGRGLRRTSYETNPETGLFEAEYVNIFGVPFTFLPHEGDEGPPPPPPLPKARSDKSSSFFAGRD